MRLAEALIERADLQMRITQLEKRMQQSAKVQEGDTPAESVEKLMFEYEGLMDELERLIVRINRTNGTTSFEGETLAEAITRRDCQKSKIRAYRGLREATAIVQDRYSKAGIKFVRCVDIDMLQKKIDGLSKSYRERDTNIQWLNWTVELLP